MFKTRPQIAANLERADVDRSVAASESHQCHQIDLLDLYAEGFDPVLSAQLRRDYHDPERNRRNNQAYVDRLMTADALVVQFPTWSFGPPAMLNLLVSRKRVMSAALACGWKRMSA